MRTVTYECDCCEKRIRPKGERTDMGIMRGGVVLHTMHYHSKCYDKVAKMFNKACEQVNGVS